MKNKLMAVVLFCAGVLAATAQEVPVLEKQKALHYVTVPANVHKVYKARNIFEGVVECSEGILYTQQNNSHDAIYDVETGRLIKDNPLGGEDSGEAPRWYNGYAYSKNSEGKHVILDAQGNTFRVLPEGSHGPVAYRILSKNIVDGMLRAIKFYQRDAYHNGYYTEYKKELVYLNERGEEIFPQLAIAITDYSQATEGNAYPFSEDLSIYQDPNTGKYGYFDRQGKIVIPARFKEAHSFSDGLALVSEDYSPYSMDHTWGYINKTGAYEIPAKFHNRPGSFHSGYAVAEKSNGKHVYINHSGNPVGSEMEDDYLSEFYDGKALKVIWTDYQTYRYGVINTNLDIVQRFECQKPFYGYGLMAVEMSNSKHWFEYNGKRYWIRYNCMLVTDDGRVWLSPSGNHDFYIVKILDGKYIYARYDDEYYVFNMEGVALFHLGEDEF